MGKREILFANFPSRISDSIVSFIAPFEDTNRADVELMINLYACKCDQAVWGLDWEKLRFGDAHKAPDGLRLSIWRSKSKKAPRRQDLVTAKGLTVAFFFDGL
ncbi:hypothetical protein [Neochlamydia sp. AcF95]|uniref:hypothetical protein n=1 Tax=Neochlamydia sp. AcF95 TaxID=2795734 RepID=UPI00201664EC|nr:hypothetical protein [Neochlamydia sp. AcF95]